MSLIQGVVQVVWGQTYLTQTMTIPVDTWTYLSLVWKSSDGKLYVYALANSELQYKVFSNVNTGSTHSMTNITLAGSSEAYMEIEHIRVWSLERDLNTIIKDRDIYTDSNTNDLLFSVPMDEGEGMTTDLTDHSGITKRSVRGEISTPMTSDLWQPSDIPITNTYARAYTKPSAANSTVLNECLEALNNTDVKAHCSAVDNLQQFLLEACISEYNRLGDKTTNETIILSLIFYCQGAFNVNECELEGYFDYCTTKETDTTDDDILLFIIIAVCLFILLLILLICICCCWYHSKCCFKNCGKRQKKDDQLFDGDDDCRGNHNPIFSRSPTQDTDTGMYVTGIGGHNVSRKMALDDRDDMVSPDSAYAGSSGRLSASGTVVYWLLWG